MILDRLIVKNFKRFRHAEICFKDGITGILGNNGTGKSSLVTAIFFALYGVKATGISADYIVSSFASPKDKCEVVLDFRIGGDSYKVIRTFRKGKTVTHDAEFYKNKQLVAKEVSPVEAEVKRTLGMGPVDFRNTIYAAQKDLLTLLDNTPTKRKEWFQKALGIDYLKTESDAVLKKQAEEKTGELQNLAGRLEALTGQQSEEELARLKASVKKFHETIAEHGKARDLIKKQRAELDAKQKVLAEKKLAYNRLLQQQQNLAREKDEDTRAAQKLEAQIALLAGEDAEYHRIEKTAASFPEVKQRLDALREKKGEHLRLTAELGFATKEIADLVARAEKQRALISAIDADLQKKDGLVKQVRAGIGAGEIAGDRLESAVSYRLAEINKQSGTLATRLEHYREEREKIAADLTTIRGAGADGVCPLCHQKLGDHFGSIEAEFAAQLQALEEKAVADLERQEKLAHEKTRIEALKPALDALRTIADKLRQKPVYEEELLGLEEKRKAKEEGQKSLGESLKKLGYDENAFLACERESAGVQKVQLRFIELGKKIGQGLQAKEQLAGITAKIAERGRELSKLAEEIKGAAFDPAEATHLEAAVAGADAALRNEEVLIAGTTKDLRFTEEKIAEYKKTAEQIALLEKQAGELKDEIELLKLTRTLIAEYVVYIMQVVRSRLEGEVSRIISEITGGRYEQVLLDEDFNLLVRDVDDDYAIDRFSGGEQDDIAVALRIALSRYLAELHHVHESTVLIFDEIFGSQDEERRNNLLTALRTQESRFPQILLISHIAEMQAEFENTLVVEMGADMASRVRAVE
ncbi:SMC family ATPase [Methanoregula sp.]|uniref:SMC family ATPase n=1 Tax=Methanoregula sp. TaxID=2052170 RepID=UPI002B73E6E2|nr:SMC family ATPase [Methanoregula sp.]HVP97464.1 SMC family ATPase [Methanoregula sp.]